MYVHIYSGYPGKSVSSAIFREEIRDSKRREKNHINVDPDMIMITVVPQNENDFLKHF